MSRFKRIKLRNGINVLFEKRDLPVVALSITNPFGGAFENSNIKGIAHFIEHLLFTGTKTRTHEDISREIEKKGGILNAYTAHEVTSYWFKLPNEYVIAGLDILTDMLNNAAFKVEKFDKEKEVIVQEIKMYHDTPSRHVYDIIESQLYDKPFGESIIGSPQTVRALKRDFVMKYFSENYSASDFIVTVVGNVDIGEICRYLESNFKSRSKKKMIQPIKLKNGRKVEEREGLDQAHFLIGMHAPLPSTPESYALEVLNAYMASGMSSRLFLKIREQKGLAYSVRGEIASEKSYSHYMIYVGTKKESIEEVERDIAEEFTGIDKMSEKDLNEAKEIN